MKKTVALFSSIMVMLMMFVITPIYAQTTVAEVDGVKFDTLKEAIEAAKEGSTVTLLADTVEDITIDKNIVIDGLNQFHISGLTIIKDGTLQNVTLKPNETNKNGSLLTIGNNAKKTKINLEKVILQYSVTNRSGGSAMTVSGNQADIKIDHCTFMNTPHNQGKVEDVLQWSYGLYINGQADTGSIQFTNNQFKGAFRTQLANVSGNFSIENCIFENSVYTVKDGPTDGAGNEATTLTTSDAKNNQIVIKNNEFNNSGAIYFQTPVTMINNTVKEDVFEHYIQANGSIQKAIDLSNNTFVVGEHHLVIIDTLTTPILLPAGQVAVNYWVWYKTPEDVRPADYSDYQYMYKEDGTVAFLPQSDVALEQFFMQNKGNIEVRNGDTIQVNNDLKLHHIIVKEDQNITFEIADDAMLEVAETLDVKGTVTIVGTGAFTVAKNGTVQIAEGAAFEVSVATTVENNGSFVNKGTMIIPENISGTGEISGAGEVVKLHDGKHIEAIAPTCDQDGNIEYWYCEYCQKYYSDKALKNEITKDEITLKALGHQYENGECTVCGKKDPNHQGEIIEKPQGEITEKPQMPNSPNTGDASNAMALFMLLLGSVGATAGMKRYNRKK